MRQQENIKSICNISIRKMFINNLKHFTELINILRQFKDNKFVLEKK